MSEKNAVIATYESHSQAGEVLKELQLSGFDMKKLSIVGRDDHTAGHTVGYYTAGGRMRRWGKAGGFWNGIWDLLAGSAFFAIPGIGPVLVAGPLSAWVAGTLEGSAATGGLSVIGAGLSAIGIPKEGIEQYESAIKSDQLLLLAHGEAHDVKAASGIMRDAGPSGVGVHTIRRQAPAGVLADASTHAGHNWLCS
ncbi:MAG: hypothetical protein SFV51_15145 [Bryobacteraceae bacterium]|nr:hypothetical protein [Bryobacteraceae bacterium]